MILDKTLLLEDNLAVSGLSVATTASTNVIDFSVGRDIGVGERIGVWAQINVAFTTAASGTFQWILQASADNSAWNTICQGPAAMPVADLIPGLLVSMVTTIRSPTMRRQNIKSRYLRFQWVVGTGVFTAGNISAGLVLDIQDWNGYPRNYVG